MRRVGSIPSTSAFERFQALIVKPPFPSNFGDYGEASAAKSLTKSLPLTPHFVVLACYLPNLRERSALNATDSERRSFVFMVLSILSTISLPVKRANSSQITLKASPDSTQISVEANRPVILRSFAFLKKETTSPNIVTFHQTGTQCYQLAAFYNTKQYQHPSSKYFIKYFGVLLSTFKRCSLPHPPHITALPPTITFTGGSVLAGPRASPSTGALTRLFIATYEDPPTPRTCALPFLHSPRFPDYLRFLSPAVVCVGRVPTPGRQLRRASDGRSQRGGQNGAIHFNSDRTDEMMYFVLDYFAGQTGVRNDSTVSGVALDLGVRGYSETRIMTGLQNVTIARSSLPSTKGHFKAEMLHTRVGHRTCLGRGTNAALRTETGTYVYITGGNARNSRNWD
ncbi:rCG65918 [Rattus norvegicus]|uniref:LRRGT00193 n=2 Tax=Rattus norvegicus TaxID=10116 RepID=F7FIV0_RAT|nr:LRRGT00193 [Rattus norvegicus]EDM07188.1 rCG65918 [Rattus norvegicus]|eukprot:NP_001041439.1 uncharacterized protein LOC680227 [Rattus norvegicus]